MAQPHGERAHRVEAPSLAACMTPPEAFQRALNSLRIELSAQEIEQLGRFIHALLSANARFNLTAVTDPAEAWMRHGYDSLTLLPYLLAAEAEQVVDIGSGGGLPAIPLAIALPGASMTLVESTGKKAAYLRETAESLGLQNVEVLADRAEILGQDRERFRERFDVATARAVGRLPVLLELMAPLVRPGGVLLAIKGEQAMEELAEARRALAELRVQHVDSSRTETGTVVVMRKSGRTPRTYPRKPGEPKRVPLR